jgi:hypothetical protein
MRIATVGLAALLTGGFAGGAVAQAPETLQDEIQDQEEPGSEIEAEVGGGEVVVGRERNMQPAPGVVFPPPGPEVVVPAPGAVLPAPGAVPPMRTPRSPITLEGQAPMNLPNDPDALQADDATDAELPGEGPEDLSGPDDDDPLPE